VSQPATKVLELRSQEWDLSLTPIGLRDRVSENVDNALFAVLWHQLAAHIRSPIARELLGIE
jgi:hypothetical protein